jgi:hypothetical protein
LKSTDDATSKLGMSSSAVYFRGNQPAARVRNLQNCGFRNLRIVESVCSRTKKEKKKKPVGGPAKFLLTGIRLSRFVHRTGTEQATQNLSAGSGVRDAAHPT